MNKQLILGFSDFTASGSEPLNSPPQYHTNDEDVESIPLTATQIPRVGISRPIHYLGSKLRLINLISQVIDTIDPASGTVCDLFAGSGTVSRELARHRSVISVDIQEYSRVLCSALLKAPGPDAQVVAAFWERARNSGRGEKLLEAIEPLVVYEAVCLEQAAAAGNFEPLCDFLEHGSLIALEQGVCGAIYPALRDALGKASAQLSRAGLTNGAAALATRHFGGIYFSFNQAAQIDALLHAVESVPALYKDSFLAAVLSTASEVVNTVGKQFAQPIRPRTVDGTPKKNLYQLVARDRFVDVFDSYENWLHRYLAIPQPERAHQVMRQDYASALESLPGQVSVVYADPPYTRDHYSRFYHVLETLCLRDDPQVSTVRIHGQERMSRGFYRVERHQSPFCIKSKAPAAFVSLFERTKELKTPLVLSYSPYEKSTGARPRVLTMDDIVELAKKSFRQVEVLRAGRIAHNKLNNSEKNVGVSYDAEALVICRP